MATEKRLIDANVVLAKQFTAGLSDASGNYYGHADVVFVNDIENAPIVDAVEVVRCKDCQSFEKKWSWDNLNTGKEECGGYCYHWDYESGMSPNQVYEDDFCSYGERKDNGQNL